MKLLILAASFIFSLNVQATTELHDCNEVKSEQLRLALTAANLANTNTTQTPEGGPYRPFDIKSCSGGSCDAVRSQNANVLKYLPDHPDANAEGYVAFPNIDIRSESLAFTISLKKLILYGKNNLCGTSVLENGDTVLLTYSSEKTGIKEDIITLNKPAFTADWGRTTPAGVRSTSSFKFSEMN